MHKGLLTSPKRRISFSRISTDRAIAGMFTADARESDNPSASLIDKRLRCLSRNPGHQYFPAILSALSNMWGMIKGYFAHVSRSDSKSSLLQHEDVLHELCFNNRIEKIWINEWPRWREPGTFFTRFNQCLCHVLRGTSNFLGEQWFSVIKCAYSLFHTGCWPTSTRACFYMISWHL